MDCIHCGTKIPADAQECPNCHLPAAMKPAETPPSYAAQTVMIKDLPLEKPAAPPTQEPPPAYAAQTVMIKDLPPIQSPPPQTPKPSNAADEPTAILNSEVPPVIVPPRQDAPPAKKKMKPAVIVGIILAVLILCCLAAAAALLLLQPAWLPFELPKLGGGASGKQSSDYIVGYLQRENLVDLNWVHGSAVDELYTDVLMDAQYNGISYIVNGVQQEYIWSAVDFLPTDPGKLLMRVMEDDETIIKIRDLKKETETEIFKSSYSYSGYLLNDGTLILIEYREDNNRAYVSDGKIEAERVLKADQLQYLPALNQLLAITMDVDETAYQLYDLAGNELVTLYEGAVPSSVLFNADGSLMVLVQPDAEVVAISTRTGEIISTNDAHASVPGLFAASQGSLMYLYGEDEDGFLTLEATTDGSWVQLAQGAKKLAAVTHQDTTQMAYVLTDEDNLSTLFIADVKTAESQAVLESEDTLDLVSETRLSDTFIAAEVADGETTLYRCSFRGGDPEILIEESEAGLSYLAGVNGTILINLYDGINNTSSLWAAPENAGEAYPLMEDWYSVYVTAAAPRGSQFAVNGVEDMGDDPVLYVVDANGDADPIEVDDDFDSLWDVYYSSDGSNLLYTVQVGDNYDDFEVRRFALNARDAEVETLYEEARVMATGWNTMDAEKTWYAYTVYPTMSSGVSRLNVGGSANGTIGGDIYETRFKTSLESEKLYRIIVKSAETVNPSIYLYDQDGMQLTYNNNYANAEESMFFAPTSAGSYEIGITDWNYGSDQTKFTIELVEVPAGVLSPGQNLSDEITASDGYTFGELTQYLRFYILPAKANDNLTITVEGFGADVPYGANLMNGYYIYQSGTYGYGDAATLYYSVYTDGNYILAIMDDSDFYGMVVDFSKDHSFTINVSN